MSQKGLFSFTQIGFDYAPYPIGYATQVFPAGIYSELAASYPSVDLFAYMPKLGKKYSLSELNNPENYFTFLKRSRIWRQAYEEVKSPEFLRRVVEMLFEHHIDIGLRDRLAPINRTADSLRRRLSDALTCLKRGSPRKVPVKSRFEFSMLPADGGHIKPHTDSPNKLITLVVSMMNEGEWDAAYGGGTSVLQPKNVRETYNHLNKYLEFEQTDEIKTFPFDPNQCVVFVKTFNSLHAVRPMTGIGSPLLRKTLTINLETYCV